MDELGALLPVGWEQRAQAAVEAVRAASDNERAAVVNQYSTVWRELKDALSQLSHKKCWYCESRQNRSDNAVDHFRPKNRVMECAHHPGYWWLAFDWRNYRFSCTFCNSRRRNKDDGTSGGKHDHFPLLREDARALSEHDDLDQENPELLDPAFISDTTILWFGDDGRVYPRCPEGRQPQYKRAETSIELYNLNHADIVEARQLLLREIRNLVDSGNDQFDRLHADNPEARRALEAAARMLNEKMAAWHEYSTAARDMVRGLRDDRHTWIDGL